jgi:hypothetical protein
MTAHVHWVNLTPGDVARAYMLMVHCHRRDSAGAQEIIREARELHRIETLSLAMAYTVVESGISDEQVNEMHQAALEFRAAELQAERLDDGPEDDDDYDDEEEERPREQ